MKRFSTGRVFAVIVIAASLLTSTASATYRTRESLMYLYGGTTQTYLSRVDKTGDSISIVAPDYYETGDDGGILYTKVPDSLLISSMQTKGIEVTPFVSNHWDRAQARAMLARSTEAVEFLAESVREYGLDGLNIDLQNINKDDREAFVSFIARLRTAMPTGSSLTVCVAANPYGTDAGWQGGYDYAALAGHCDCIFMMTYDESYNGGPAGPVASYKFIENSIKNGLKYVPPEKLMLGIPFYGRYWTDTVRGAAWTVSDIEHLIALTGAVPWYDEKNECARVTITVGKNDNLTTWGGTRLAAGVYDVWYENARSYEKKLALVREYDLRGVGCWALGQEPSWMWDSFSVWLDGNQFTDITGHWASSYILDLNDQGIIKGVSTGKFAPEIGLTRAEAAALLVRIAGIEEKTGAAAFSDTANHWANGTIAAARDVGLVNGVSATKFEPERRITREEFAVMAERYTNITDTLDLYAPLFSDVSQSGNPWSNAAIIKLSVNRVFGGYPDGTFRPQHGITRAEAAKVVTVLMKLPTRFVNGSVLPLQNDTIMGPR